jgi:hypothetical protein
MVKKFIITEEEKKHILGLYDILNEQIEIPDFTDFSPQQWNAWHEENVVQKFLKETLEDKKVRSRNRGGAEISLEKGIKEIVGDSMGNFLYFLKYIKRKNLISTNRMSSIAAATQAGQIAANQIYDMWEENYGRVFNLNVGKSIQELPGENKGGVVEFEIKFQPDPSGQLYVNNEWEVSDVLKSDFRDQITSMINNAKSQDPNLILELKSLDIKTSASRFRNTGPRAGSLSFAELSNNRNESSKNFILEELNNLNININNAEITQESLGENKDGSTGPNPPDPYKYIDGGNVKMNTNPTKQRNEFGEPHSTPEEYDKYKYLIVTMLFKATVKNKVNPKPQKHEVFEFDLKAKRKKVIPLSIVKLKSGPKPLKWKLFKDISFWFKTKPKKCYD